MRNWCRWAVTLAFVFAYAGCHSKPRATGESAATGVAEAPRPSHPPTAADCSGAPALPLAPLVVNASNGGEPRWFRAGTDGVVRLKDVVVGQISGACILDVHGAVLRFVDAGGAVFRGDGEPAGVFRDAAGWRDPDDRGAVGEVLTDPGDPAAPLGAKIDGNLYEASRTAPGTSLPAGIMGGRNARRTALLLFAVNGELEGHAP